MTKVLNLYAGIGGNRAGWPVDVQVTAVELDPQVAEAYATLWPGDDLVIGDAHQYLLEHFMDGWGLIWTSPPCPSHSKLRRFEHARGHYVYPRLDMLYGEIILLQSFCPPDTAFLVENVIPYYPPLIPPTGQLGRHYAWSNRSLPMVAVDAYGLRISRDRKSSYRRRKATLSPMECAEETDFQQAYGITLPACADTWGRYMRRQVMRNCVDPVIGEAVWDACLGHEHAHQGTLLEVAA
ncbi:MAG: DNA cytosine methyltransferase [Propionibacteriaceae bacterium]|jgi:DNA (cytosine-5)-methyltransferase 1|nr:DNA cytosine methyltransferase [Propionibacteriaceae bacterium]